MGKPGFYLLGGGTIAAGVLDVIWRDFDTGHQPIQFLGFEVPGRSIFAIAVGIWLMVGGGALLWRRTSRGGIWATAIIYSVIGLFSIPLLPAMLHKYGFHVTLVLGVMGEMLQQYIVVGGCLVLASSLMPAASRSSRRLRLAARLIIGLSSLLFGVAHFDNTRGIVPMIPHWIPLSPSLWVQISGLGFVLAGVAILSGILQGVAARLLALMLLIFEIILVPLVFVHPHVHTAWGASAYNLTVAGSVLLLAGAKTEEVGA